MKHEALFNLIHNLANDLKAGLIDWYEFDKRLAVLLEN